MFVSLWAVWFLTLSFQHFLSIYPSIHSYVHLWIWIVSVWICLEFTNCLLTDECSGTNHNVLNKVSRVSCHYSTMNYPKKTGFGITYSMKTWFLKNLSVSIYVYVIWTSIYLFCGMANFCLSINLQEFLCVSWALKDFSKRNLMYFYISYTCTLLSKGAWWTSKKKCFIAKKWLAKNWNGFCQNILYPF